MISSLIHSFHRRSHPSLAVLRTFRHNRPTAPPLAPTIRPASTTAQARQGPKLVVNLQDAKATTRRRARMTTAEIQRRDAILAHAGHLLARNKRGLALETFNELVADLKESTAQSARERAINLFIQHKALVQALDIFESHIQDGHTPSTATTTRLLRAAGAANPPKPRIAQRVMKELEKGNIAWDAHLVGAVISNLSSAGRPDLMEEIVEGFTATNENAEPRVLTEAIYSMMIKGYGRVGDMDAGVRWLQKYRADCSSNQGLERSQGPYIHLLTAFAERPRQGGHARVNDACYTILKQMVMDGITPSMVGMNIVLAMEVRDGNFRRVAAIWRVLKRWMDTEAPHSSKPDSTTYATLFTALGYNRMSDRIRAKLPTGRALYKHMLNAHHEYACARPSAPSPFLRTSTLNVALRYFMENRDYFAATVVLRTFHVCRRVPTERTEWIVASSILRRMGKDVLAKTSVGPDGKEDYASWVDKMHGRVVGLDRAKEESRHIRTLLREMKESQRARRILSAAEVGRAEKILESLGYDLTGREPEPPTIANSSPGSEGRQVSLKKTHALITQAIMADLEVSTGLKGNPSEVERSFKVLIASALDEMLPERTSSRDYAGGSKLEPVWGLLEERAKSRSLRVLLDR